MVAEKIKEILSEQLDIEVEEIALDSDIAEDLGADSLDVVDLIMTLEDEFEVEISDDVIESVKTVGDLVNFIESNR